MEQSIEQARQILKDQAERLRKELSELDAKRNEKAALLAQAENGLRGLESKIPSKLTSITSNQFRGKRLADAIEEYIESQKHEVSIDELLDAMRQGSANLGNTPAREWTNIKIAVSTNPTMFTLEGKMVGLMAWKKKPSAG